jgi:hypothetical protein
MTDSIHPDRGMPIEQVSEQVLHCGDVATPVVAEDYERVSCHGSSINGFGFVQAAEGK